MCVVFCICITICAHVTQPAASQSNFRFQHFDINDGLASDLAYQILQDSLGFLWICQAWSVSRYDGYEFKTYRYDPDDKERSLGNDILGSAYLDRSGNFWVTSTNQKKGLQINRYDRTIDGFRKYRVFTEGYVVNVSFEENNKTLWLSTENGICSFNLETKQTEHFLNDLPDSLSRSLANNVYDISVMDSSLLIATGKGIWMFDKFRKTFSRPLCDPTDSAWIYDTVFLEIYDTRSRDFDNVWLFDNASLTKVNKDLAVVQRLPFPNGLMRDLRRYDTDKDGVFWFGSWFKGIFRYDPSDSSFMFIKSKEGDPYSLRTNRINDVKIDRHQNIWAATHQGISKLPKTGLDFYNVAITDARIDQSAVYEAGGSEYVVADWYAEQHSLKMAPLIRGKLDSLEFKEITDGFKGNQVNSFWKGERNFWIASWGRGVVGFPIDQESGMIRSGPVTTFSNSVSNPNTISSNSTISVWEDGDENLWVGTSGGGLNKIVPGIPYGRKGSVIRYQHSDTDSTTIADDSTPCFYPENDSSFWLTTLKSVDLYRNGRFEHFFLNDHLPSALLKNRDGILFVGTGTGLFAGRKQQTQYNFSKALPLKKNDILNIKEDQLGRLWIVTGQGMTFYDHEQNIAIEFNEKDGFKHHRIYHSSLNPSLTSSGIMVMSDATGLTLFEPLTIRVNRAKTFPLFTSLTVNNKPTLSGYFENPTEHFTIKTDISVLDELILDYRHNNFTIGFSAMELTSPEKNLYRHKLEGYDDDWIETGWRSRAATYTNLDPGVYTFKVKASNYHGIWNENEKTLKVVILPPPWKTWWAYTLYGLALILIAGYWRRYEIRRVKLKNQAQHLRELDTLKTRFFTNISHEFRTPITLILGPLKDLYNGTSKDDPKAVLGPVIRNGQRLLRLINQLLDISKLEAGKMQLHISRVEMVEFLRGLASSYESLATEKKIKYLFYPELHEVSLYIDKEKIEKVVNNLLSNAFKFTNEGGEVVLFFKVTEENAVIEVKDTGIGIDPAEIEKIFDRFYQVDSSQTRAHEGSGLGMALAKELVLLHHGNIAVESKPGKGTTFTVSLPLGKKHLKAENISDEKILSGKQYPDDLIPQDKEIKNEEPATSVLSDQPVVLIVEDNRDMRNYIRKSLSGLYHILEAENGKQGLQQALQIIPDLIISDIMMPEMDGYRLCHKIKNHELTNHIIVILLTAKADRESKLEGLETGADDYLSKPFDADELRLIVRNRLEERRKMREHFSRAVTLEPSQVRITSQDEKFLQKVLALIEEHMDDGQYSVENFGQDAGYSNVQFYRKIKALSGQTPSQFIRSIRLKRAAELLRNKSDNVSQIAYSVGFASQSYFTKCFKEQYGVTPGEFSGSVDIKK